MTQPSSIDPPASASFSERMHPQQFLLLGLCMTLNMLDGFDITAMAVVANPVSQELGLAPERLGWIFSFALAGMTAGAMLLAPVSDRIGRRWMIVGSALLVSVSILLTAFADSLGEFIALRFLSGLGAGAMLASQAALAAEYSPERFKAAAVAVVTSGYPLGAMLTSVVAGFVMPEYGWRGMFAFGGGLTLLLAFVALLAMPESVMFLTERQPKNALARANRILKRMGRAPLAALPERSAVAAVSANQVGKLLSGPFLKPTLLLWTAFFLSFSSLYFLVSWIPKMMEDFGYTAEVGRHAFFLYNLGGVLGVYLLGILSIRLALTHVIATLLISGGIGMVIFAYVPGNLTLGLSLIFAIGLLQQGGFTGLYSAAAKTYPTEFRSTGVGWGIGLGRLGAVAGPALAGYLIAAGLSISDNFLVFAVPTILGGVFAFLLRVR